MPLSINLESRSDRFRNILKSKDYKSEDKEDTSVSLCYTWESPGGVLVVKGERKVQVSISGLMSGHIEGFGQIDHQTFLLDKPGATA